MLINDLQREKIPYSCLLRCLREGRSLKLQVPITEKGEKEFDALNEKGKWLMDKVTKELGVKRAERERIHKEKL